MKVFVWIKIKEHPQPDGQGAQKGDIIEILPVDADPGKKTPNSFMPVLIDIKVPCGVEFYKKRCSRCEYNYPDSCDVRKYKTAIWGPGSIDQEPKVVKKRKYYIDRSTFGNPLSEQLIINENKTEAEKAELTTYALNNEFSISSIQEKI